MSAKPDPSPPTEESLLSIFHEAGSVADFPLLSHESVRYQLRDIVKAAQLIDRPSIQTTAGPVELLPEDLTRTFNGLVKIGEDIRKVVPGLFLEQPKNATEEQQIAIAQFALARYFASLDGNKNAGDILSVLTQIRNLFRGNQVNIPPAGTIGTPALLDAYLPQWRKIGNSDWKTPIGRHRGNWMEKIQSPVTEYLAKRLIVLFPLRGWSIAEFEKTKTKARRNFFSAFRQAYQLACRREIELRSLYTPFKNACAWSKTEEARREMDWLLKMDPVRVQDAKRAAQHLC